MIYAIVKEAAVFHRLETFRVEDVMDPLEVEADEVSLEEGSDRKQAESQ